MQHLYSMRFGEVSASPTAKGLDTVQLATQRLYSTHQIIIRLISQVLIAESFITSNDDR